MSGTTHPGEVLREDYLEPLGMSQSDLARSIGISLQRVRGVTPETALLFSQAFETSPEFWMNLQTGFDLSTCVGRGRVPKVRSLILHRARR